MQFIAVLALGAIVTFLVDHWERFIGDKDTAFLIGFPTLCLIAWIYDQASLRESNKATTEPER
jgi:hypothetical protein